MRRIQHAAAVGIGVGLAASRVLAAPVADPLPPIPQGTIHIELQTIATGLAAPNFLEQGPEIGDGNERLFVVDQSGQLRLIKNGTLQATPALDVASEMPTLGILGSFDENDFDERGLLGVAFHPGFADPSSPGFRKLYTFHTQPANTAPADFTVTTTGAKNAQNVVTEWQMDAVNPDVVDMSTRREVFRLDKPQFNHNGGQVSFGPDGYLYVSIGDGGAADDQGDGHSAQGNGQDTSVILGKMVRIDPLDPSLTPASFDAPSANGNYRVPASNPFVGSAGLDEIFAHGFRNPFRFSFDSASGDLIVADVGQNHIEEVDIVTNGGNYGWRLKEGTFVFDPNGGSPGFVTDDPSPPGLIDPVAQYDHGDGLSAIGGFVYHGSAIPELQGKYVFGDFSTGFFSPAGRLFYADLTTGMIEEFQLGEIDRDLGLFVKGFGQDVDGELYLLAGPNLGPYGTQGQVLKIVAVPEPATLAVLAAGVVAVISRRRVQSGE
jgi:glucose/arabinose dehydrogenase